jgi:hypothetical protein
MDKLALILDGGVADGEDTRGVGAIADDVLRCEGWRVTTLTLREIDIAPCLGCFGCWVKTPGVCVIDDAGRDVARQMMQSDLLVFLTPLTFGGYSSELKKALDRWIPNITPLFRLIKGEVHHAKRYARYPRVIGIGLCSDGRADPDEEELFETLVDRNAINLHAPASAACVIDLTDDDEVRRRRIERALEKVIGS